MASSEQLEREAQATRSRIEQTLAELRLRISPGQIVDQAVDYARDTTGGDFVSNLSRKVADNPVTIALMGAGPKDIVIDAVPAVREEASR